MALLFPCPSVVTSLIEGLEESKEGAGAGEEGEAYLFDLFLAIFHFV